MNREQKRNYTRYLKSKGMTEQNIKSLIHSQEVQERLKSTFKYFKEGDRVKLNLESIKEDVDYDRKSSKWKKFIEDNTDKVFTIEYDRKRKDTVMVCLKEDTTDPKWLWWEGDLQLIEEENK